MKDPEERCKDLERPVEKLENAIEEISTEMYRPKATFPEVKRRVGRILVELRKS